jgi:hypothetical protein
MRRKVSPNVSFSNFLIGIDHFSHNQWNAGEIINDVDNSYDDQPKRESEKVARHRPSVIVVWEVINAWEKRNDEIKNSHNRKERTEKPYPVKGASFKLHPHILAVIDVDDDCSSNLKEMSGGKFSNGICTRGKTLRWFIKTPRNKTVDVGEWDHLHLSRIQAVNVWEVSRIKLPLHHFMNDPYQETVD